VLNTKYIPHQPANRENGFGLIELMIAVAILGIVLAFAIPSYKEWIENTKIRSIAESILNGVQRARAEAVTNNTAAVFTLSNNNWTVGCVTASVNCAAVIDQYTADSTSGNVTATPDPISKTTVTFTPLGVIRDPVTNSFNLVDVASSVAGTRPMRVEIGLGGSARLCDPAFAIADTPRGCNP
jgi:type IV fimbrial biogenesis protein FimT